MSIVHIADQLFGSRLRSERERLALSQARLAHLCEVSRTTLGAYEADRCEPSAGFLTRLAASGGDVHFVLTGRRFDLEVDEALDWDLLAQVYGWIEDWAHSRGRPTATETKFRLLKSAYNYCRATKNPPDMALQHFAELAA